MRVVLDTNVLIDGSSDDFSAAAQLITAATEGKLQALATPAVEREYRVILRRLVKDEDYEQRILDFLRAVEEVRPAAVDVTIDDTEDYKFLQAAVGGSADLLVTNDRHLLAAGEAGSVKIVTPQEAWAKWQDESEEGAAGGWREWAKGLGIGR